MRKLLLLLLVVLGCGKDPVSPPHVEHYALRQVGADPTPWTYADGLKIHRGSITLRFADSTFVDSLVIDYPDNPRYVDVITGSFSVAGATATLWYAGGELPVESPYDGKELRIDWLTFGAPKQWRYVR